MVQHTNTKQNWYQVSSSKTSAKAANKELHFTFTIHLCPSLSISDLESHCKTYPLTSWPCGWFSPSQFSPFCWLYTPRTQDVTQSLLYSSVQSTLQTVSQQQQCAGEAALTTAAFLRLSPAAAGAGLLYNCYPLSQCSHRSNLVIIIYYLLSRYWFEIIFDGFIYCTVFSMILIRWSNKYFPKFIHISISASNLDNIQYNL